MITLILKGTNGCNLNCSYCSLGEKKEHDIVSESRLDSIFDYICNLCLSRNENTLNVILHGGEPTLIPVGVYDRVIEHIKSAFPEINMSFSIQTNAFCITDEYLSFFKRNNINIGVSVDGSEKIHDTERRSKNDRNTFKKVIDNIERMQESGLNVSALMVLTSVGLSSPVDFLKYYSSRHINLKINPLLNYGEACKNPGLALKKGDYAGYLIRVYEYILENDIDLAVSPIDKILNAIITKDRIRECTFNSVCNKGFICIDHKGDIYPCGKYSDIHEFKLGNIDDKIYVFDDNCQFSSLLNRRSCNMPLECQKCEYMNICNAGCNAEASIEGKFDEPPFLCEDYKILFKYFRGEGLRLLRDKMIKRKQQLMEEADGI